MGKVLIWKWKISHLRYSLYCKDSSIKIETLYITFEEIFSDLKYVASISSGFFVSKIGEKLS